MAGESGDRSKRVGKWGIYDRLRQVPLFTGPKSAGVGLGPHRKMDATEKAAEIAARRMVEDHFKEKNDARDPMADFVLVSSNEFLQRRHKQQEQEDTAVCECVYVDGDADSACGRQCLNVLKNTECRSSHCPAGEQCKNQRFQQNQYAKAKLTKTTNRGWGLAADEYLEAGDFIVEYCGEVVPNKEAYFRAKVYQASGLKDSYLISLNSTEYIDATRKGSMGRFINHSCEPNCEMNKWTVLGEDRIGIFATVDIISGTELTYDYHKSGWYGGSSKIKCACGAKACVGNLVTNSRHLQQKDAYAWEDDIERDQVEESGVSTDEDDAPLSSFIKGLVPKNLKGLPSTKGGGILAKTAVVEKASTIPATVISKESPQLVKDPTQGQSAESSILKTAENSPLVRGSKTTITTRGDNSQTIATVVGKLKETPSESRLKRVITKFPDKRNTLEEEEINVDRKRARSDAEVQDNEKTAAASLEQMLSDNQSRVAAFTRARNSFNKQLAEDNSSSFPISEAALAEVEFAQEVEVAAVWDLKKVCEDINPAMKEFQKADKEVSLEVSRKWMQAHFKQLDSTLKFHFSIVRHLAGPTFSLSQPKKSTP